MLLCSKHIISNKYMFVIFLSLYLFFMFNIFKTNIGFYHPLEYYLIGNLGDYFKHPIGTMEYGNKICPFGQQAIFFLIAYLILSECVGELKYFSKLVLVITMILSLLNLNAFIYLLPYFAYSLLIC